MISPKIKRLSLFLLLIALLPSAVLTAQKPLLRAEGHVMKPGPDSVIPVQGVWVTLHRVGRDSAGPVDSVRTDARGAYRLDFRPFGVENAIYFAATMYHGIAYFSAPIGMSGQGSGFDGPGNTDGSEGEEGDLMVFDTSSGPIPIAVRGRHVIIASPDSNRMRRITEVFEVANDSFVTRVAKGESDEHGDAVWSTPYLEAAVELTLMEGDISTEAVRFFNGRLLTFAPIAPGLKQIAFTYLLPDSIFPTGIPLESEVTILEVLIEEGSASASGGGLSQVAPVTLENRQFIRFIASDVPANSTIRIELPEQRSTIPPWAMVAITLIIGGGMVGTLVWAMRRKQPT